MLKSIVKNISVFILITLLLAGCVKDNQENVTPDDQKTISFSLSDAEEITVRSDASQGERLLRDLYLLVFGSDGKYKDGEKVDIGTKLSVNGDKLLSVRTQLPIAINDKIVVLGNTGQTSMPSGMAQGVTTVDDINSIFTSATWYNFILLQSTGIPMSGEVIYKGAAETKCELKRAVGKVELVFKEPLDVDVTGKFSYANIQTYSMYGYPLSNIHTSRVYTGNIYNPSDTLSYPTNIPLSSGGEVGSGADYYQSTYYLCEFPFSNMYVPNGSNQHFEPLPNDTDFNAKRFCLMIHFKSGVGVQGYYRIDLFDKTTGKYLDIKRNHHYKIIISKVKSFGYSTRDEALNNPPSNIEYDIHITGDDENDTSSNGQYSVSVDNSNITLFDDNTDKLKISFTAPVAVNLTTSYVDFVTTGTSNVVDVSAYKFRIDGVGYINKRIPLTVPSDFTGKKEFVMTMENAVYHSEQKSIATALGNISARIHLGNIIKEVPIIVNDVAFYYGISNSIEIPNGGSGSYSFDVTPYTTGSSLYGYENRPDRELSLPASAALLWSEHFPSGLTNIALAESNGMYTVSFNADATVKGNSVIAIYDSNSRLLWSYHIWISGRTDATNHRYSAIVWSSPYAVTSGQKIMDNKYEMMDRNLGATSAEPPSAANNMSNESYGMYYQWGRKDPFVGTIAYNDNSTIRTMYRANGATIARSKTNSTSTTGTIAYSVMNPMVFIFNTAGPNDWLFDSSAANNFYSERWGHPNPTSYSLRLDSSHETLGNKSIYDPCPKGYQVPPQDVFSMAIKNPTAITPNKTQWNVETTTLTKYYGYKIYYSAVDEGNTAYLPAAGAMGQTTGNYGSVSSEGLYWHNTDSGKGDYSASRTSFGGAYINFIWWGTRAGGYQVRCVKEK